MSRKARKTTFIPVMLAVIFAALCIISPLSYALIVRPLLANFDSRYHSGHVAPMPFDRNMWLAGKARHRVGMAQYLAEKMLLEGKSRAELVEMLGEPDIDKSGPEGMRWLLGYSAKGLFDETMWLEMTIYEDGKASGAIIGIDWYDPRGQ